MQQDDKSFDQTAAPTERGGEAQASAPAEREALEQEAPGSEEQQGPSPEELQRQLAEVQKTADESREQILRLRAELDNVHKRSERELQNAHKFALEGFAQALLPVVDSIELGLTAAGDDNADVAKLREGGELTVKQLKAILDKFGIHEVNPVHERFNPEFHQAMSVQESAEFAPNTVLHVVQKGYLLNERLIRPALVIVSRQPEGADEERPHIDETA